MEVPHALRTDPTDAPLFATSTYEASSGSYVAGFTSFMIHDVTRADRPIPVYVWYPANAGSVDDASPEAVYPLDPFFDALPVATSSNFEAYGLDRAYQEPAVAAGGPYPLVMFSPGWGAAAYDHTYIGTRLASHGVIVAAVTHYGDGTTFNSSEPYDHLALACYNRPRDVSAALDAMLDRNATSGDPLYGLIDPSRIVASGWSLGGYASMVLAAGDDLVCDRTDVLPGWPIPPGLCVPSYPDTRFSAIIPLDGSNQNLHFYELARVEVPTLAMGQEWDALEAQFPGEASWQARQHAAFAGHPSYRVDVNKANHVSFANLCESWQVVGDLGILPPSVVAELLGMYCGPDVIEPLEAHRLVTQYMLALLHHEQRYLTPGYAITSEPDIEFFVTEKRNPHAIEDDWPDYFWYFMHQPGSGTARAEKDPRDRLPVPYVGLRR
jgi:predicted dienelactone hydrolase